MIKRSAKRLFRFEHVSQSVATLDEFVCRWLNSTAFALTLIIGWILIGAICYHYLEGRAWLEAFPDAAMIMSGKGLLRNPEMVGGKVFAILYAICSGPLLAVATGIVLAPPFHRVLHHLHGSGEDTSDTSASGGESDMASEPQYVADVPEAD